MQRSLPRRILKWFMLLWFFAIFATVLASSRWHVAWGRDHFTVHLHRGGIVAIETVYAIEDSRWEAVRQYRDAVWWFRARPNGGNGIAVYFPLWVPWLLTAIGAVWLWYRDSPHPPGYCQRCGYDLTGNESGVCPECATKVAGAAAGESTPPTST